MENNNIIQKSNSKSFFTLLDCEDLQSKDSKLFYKNERVVILQVSNHKSGNPWVELIAYNDLDLKKDSRIFLMNLEIPEQLSQKQEEIEKLQTENIKYDAKTRLFSGEITDKSMNDLFEKIFLSNKEEMSTEINTKLSEIFNEMGFQNIMIQLANLIDKEPIEDVKVNVKFTVKNRRSSDMTIGA